MSPRKFVSPRKFEKSTRCHLEAQRTQCDLGALHRLRLAIDGAVKLAEQAAASADVALQPAVHVQRRRLKLAQPGDPA